MDRLVEIFRKFPGIGPRQAKRFAYHVIRLSGADARELSQAIIDIKKHTKLCASCFRYFSSEKEASLCSICSDKNRAADELMIVAHDNDLEVIEKSGTYHGQYFVLGGYVPILEQVPSYIREEALIKRVRELLQKGLKEIIIAMSVTAEGDHTVSYITQAIAPAVGGKIAITTLGRGVSTGSELEYADSDTIKSAFLGRKKL